MNLDVASEPMLRRGSAIRLPASLPGRGGYVYFFANGTNEIVKIGRTSGTIAKRLEDIRRMSPVDPESLTCRAAIPALNARELNAAERDLHALFDSERRHGEWFTLSDRIEIAVQTALEAWGVPTEPLLHSAATLRLQDHLHDLEAAVEDWNLLVSGWYHRWRHLTADRLQPLGRKSDMSLPLAHSLPVPIFDRLPKWDGDDGSAVATVELIRRRVAHL